MNDAAVDELGPVDYLVVEFPADKADFWLSSRFGGDSSVGERDFDAGAAEVDHCDQRVGGVESVCAV